MTTEQPSYVACSFTESRCIATDLANDLWTQIWMVASGRTFRHGLVELNYREVNNRRQITEAGVWVGRTDRAGGKQR